MYNKEIKDVILTLYKNLVREKKKGSLLCSINNPLKRASTLTGLSLSNIREWTNNLVTDEIVDRRRIKGGKLDNFDLDLVIRAVKEMLENQQVVTLRKLKRELETEKQITVSKITLCRILKSKGFRFKRTNENRKALTERGDLIAARIKYLREIKDAKETMNVVYLDESWVNCHHTYPKEWISEDKSVARRIPTGRGQRLIILHAVDDKRGFLPDCLLLFKSLSTDGRDYHTEMNSTIFEHWVTHKLLTSLEETSCIVMDNATYHSRRCPETIAPTMAKRKDVMKEWLTERGIPFHSKSLKAELYALIKKYKPKPEYVVDRLITQHGHKVLRLPPYHCDLNPIEQLWGIIKNDVARNNTDFKLDSMKKLTEEAINRVSLNVIKKTFGHAIKVEKEYWKKDGLQFAPIVQPAIIETNDSSSSSSESDSSDDEIP